MPLTFPSAPFRLHTAPFEENGLVVAQLTGLEALSRPYSFDLLALTPEPVWLNGLPPLGQAATLVLHGDEVGDQGPRRVHGVLSRVAFAGAAHDRRGAWLELRLVPRLWTLKHRRTRRIFQDRTVQQIADAILAPHEVPWRWSVDAPLPTLAYTVQYDESDLEFLQRLFARFGLLYYFEQAEQGGGSEAHETLVVCDAARHYPALAPGSDDAPRVLSFVDRDEASRREPAVLKFAHERRVLPTAVRLRDWDFRSPGVFGEQARTSSMEPALGIERLQVDEYEGREGNDTHRTMAAHAQTALEQQRAETVQVAGTSDCVGFAPGRHFVLDHHDVVDLNARWVLTEVRHEGRVAELIRAASSEAATRPPVYVNHFVCAPAAVPVRPPRPERVLHQVMETAVVVGPASEEIHTDELGRIKVQFPWDRDGHLDENSSCWLRVMQPWAGVGWGSQFIPRIGMEVLVSFVGGDMDRPVVVGSLYNAQRPPSFALPSDKSRSGIRTESTPGGNGYNELSFEDAAGQEQIHLHAQRDLDEVVGRNHTLRVARDEAIQIGASRMDHVGANRVETVGADAFDTVSGNRHERVHGHSSEQVEGDQTVRVQGSRVDVVGGQVDARVAGDRTVRIEGHDRHELHRVTTEVRQDALTRVGGSHTVIVGTHEARRSYELFVEGLSTLTSTEKTTIEAEKELVLRCGTSMIRMGPKQIELIADAVIVRGKGASIALGEDKAHIRARNEVLARSETVGLKSSGALVKLTGEAKIDGSKVKLKSPDSVSTEDQEEDARLTTIELTDPDGHPLPRQRFIVILSDGSERAGVTDDEGRAQLELDADAHIIFPELTVTRDG